MAVDLSHYLQTRTLPDGRLCGVARLIFHWTLHVDIGDYGYEDRYCFKTEDLAVTALAAWDGKDDPEGWHRHPLSGRRRDLGTGREWIER